MLPSPSCELPESVSTDVPPSPSGAREVSSRDPKGMDRGARNLALLKIVVVGTPKTGNTWVKHLLAAVYDLPIVRLSPHFCVGEVHAAGARWIAHQHFLPTQDLLDWGLANDVAFVTAVRHPGDVLISLWHHVHTQGLDTENPDSTHAASMRQDEGEIGEHTRRFVEEGFHIYLNMSVAWLRRSLTSVVRYEALWDSPLETMRSLTDDILPVPEDRVGLAVSTCELALMQSVLDPQKKFIRLGGAGGWVGGLPQAIKQVLNVLDPYPQQFAALGYTMSDSDPANSRTRTATSVGGLFESGRSFDNGVPITPILMKAYFDLPKTLRSRWTHPLATGDDSFYAWLNRPTAADPEAGRVVPVITELEFYIYSVRPDVQRAVPAIFRGDRWRFNEWILFNARQEYALDGAFMRSNPFPADNRLGDGTVVTHLLVRAWHELPEASRLRWSDPTRTGAGSFLAWLNSAASDDPFAGKIAPVVTELGAYLHAIRSDVATAMPDLYSQHRVNFTNWFISSARQEYKLDRALTLPVIRSWAEMADDIMPSAASERCCA